MSARKSSSTKRRLTFAVGLLPMIALGACADYMQHSDRITWSAGDAVAHNKVVHTTDPWPRSAANTRIAGNGQRVDRITQHYLSGNGAEASTSAPAPAASPPTNSANPQNQQPSR